MPTTERWHARLAVVALLLAAMLPLALRAQPKVPPAVDAPTTPALRVGVMTMQPGTIFWERFGHDAIVIVDPRSGQATSYNYGYFDLDEPGFTGRFVRGTMQYMLAALPLEQDLAIYRDEGRGVSIQWLNLDAAQARRLQQQLEMEARPENARYHYDYFTANCATKVRDALDATLGGELHRQIAGRSRGNTYRSEAVRLASPATWLWLGFDIGLSRAADQQLSRWGEAFIPMRLADSLGEVRLADGRPLVASTQVLLPHRIAAEPGERPRPWWPWGLAGVALAIAIATLGRRHSRWVARLALPFWLVCAVIGGVLGYLWLFTAHWAAWGNENLLLFSPLCLLLLPGGLRMARGRDGGRWFRGALGVVAASAVVALLLKWVLLASQANMPWVALLLPVHLALWHALARRPATALR